MLHVLDGDATVSDFRAALLPGDVAVWREALIEGPWPRPLRGVDDAVRATREAMQKDDEIVLWFDTDLFCRLHAAYFAAHFVGARMTNAIGSHAERSNMRALLDRRFAVDPALAEVWHAYAAPDPRALVPLVERFPWVRLHLERFPHARDGLSALERRVLALLRDGGPMPSAQLFRKVAADEFSSTSYGLGDLQLDQALRDLHPLVVPSPSPNAAWALADRGRAVLEGHASFAPPADRMLGGARAREWRWDGTSLVET